MGNFMEDICITNQTPLSHQRRIYMRINNIDTKCDFCKRPNAFYENYEKEGNTFRLFNCIFCGFKRKVPKQKIINLEDLQKTLL